VTCGKPALALLQEARAYDDRDMTSLFIDCPAFADVREDPEFLQAIGQTNLGPSAPAHDPTKAG